MNRPAVFAHAASREQERARAAFKRRIADVTAWLGTWSDLRLHDMPTGGHDIHGQQNVVFHAHLGRRAVVVKVYATVATHCATAEVAAIDRYSTFGLPVPNVVDVRTGHLAGGTSCTAVVLDRLPGQPLSLQLRQCEPEEAERAGEQVGRLLAVQHHAERRPTTPTRFLQASWQRIRERYEQTLTTELDVNPLQLDDMTRRSRSLPDPATLGWVTFDWRLRHLLWNGTTITGLLDLEYTKPYDSAVELANLLHDATSQLAPARRQAFTHAARSAYEAHIQPPDRPPDDRLLFCMARQAFSHATVKHWQGVHDQRITNELHQAAHYLAANRLDDVLHHATGTPDRNQP
jgi:phosphotransferase family enzyme